jgi:phosphomannomutase
LDPSIFQQNEIVGIYPSQINEEGAWKIGCAAGRFLPAFLRGYERGQTNSRSLCVGHDMRTHSPAIARALIDGIRSTGTDVIDVGMIDTPQMYFAINHLGTCGGVQVTASHNPAKYNGFKISGINAKPIGGDTGLKDIEHIAMALLHTKGNLTGSVRQHDLTGEYKKHVLKFRRPRTSDLVNVQNKSRTAATSPRSDVPLRRFKRMKIAIDASNGMAGKMVPAIFSGLGVEIIEINFEHAGKFRHEPNPMIEKNLRQVKSAVKKNNCAMGFCFDGDADRLMTVDEKGKNISCDQMTALLGQYFLEKDPKSTVVYDLRSSRIVAEEVIKYGGTPRRERVGHAYMKKAMRDSRAVFGGELSGHFYYRDNFYADSGMITLVHMMNIVSAADAPLSELIAPLKRYYNSGEMNFEVDDKQARMDELARRYSDGQVDNLDGVTVGYKEWWFNCRPSNTEPLLRLNIEAKTKDLLEEKLAEMTQLLGEPV